MIGCKLIELESRPVLLDGLFGTIAPDLSVLVDCCFSICWRIDVEPEATLGVLVFKLERPLLTLLFVLEKLGVLCAEWSICCSPSESSLLLLLF